MTRGIFHMNAVNIILLFLFACFTSCDIGRTPSKQRLEWVCKVKLPDEFVVLKDEYKDMWQNYCVWYEIQFTEMSRDQFIRSIKNSVYFNPKARNQGIVLEDFIGKADRTNKPWQKCGNGYTFHQKKGLTTYWIMLDTLKNTLIYEECAN